ncbi:hypothetical protein FQN60_016564, partial [Etheostoma spectabile]
MGRAVFLLPPQVALVPQAVGAPIGISPAPTHHGHRLVTEPRQKKTGQAAEMSGCCQATTGWPNLIPLGPSAPVDFNPWILDFFYVVIH